MRRELVTGQTGRRALRAHDLRGSFVTVALARGATEAWVTDRTGHTTSTQLAVYRRAARGAAELGLGDWHPLLEVLAETASGSRPVSAQPDATPVDRVREAVLSMVRKEGLEPPRREASEPKSDASAIPPLARW